jgi:hypothetical protein
MRLPCPFPAPSAKEDEAICLPRIRCAEAGNVNNNPVIRITVMSRISESSS